MFFVDPLRTFFFKITNYNSNSTSKIFRHCLNKLLKQKMKSARQEDLFSTIISNFAEKQRFLLNNVKKPEY